VSQNVRGISSTCHKMSEASALRVTECQRHQLYVSQNARGISSVCHKMPEASAHCVKPLMVQKWEEFGVHAPSHIFEKHHSGRKPVHSTGAGPLIALCKHQPMRTARRTPDGMHEKGQRGQHVGGGCRAR